jgi:hypothetical protein
MIGLGWATVTGVSPFTVLLDGSASSSTVNINATGVSPVIGDRVMWTMVGKQLVVIADPRPPGEVMMYSVSMINPPGPLWKLCDGSSILIGTYPGLEARYLAEGWPHGQADGTHYYLPFIHDGNSRVIRGGPPGVLGGNATHSHTVSGHSHTTPNHQHNLSSNGWAKVAAPSNGISIKQVTGISFIADFLYSITRAADGTSRTIGAELGGQTDGAGGLLSTGLASPGTDLQSNYPPYAQMGFWVKVA